MISKNQIKLVKALHQKKFRDEERCFIAEGIKSVEEIILQRAGLIRELYCTAEFINHHTKILSENKIAYTVISNEDLEKISALKTPNQALAVCHYLAVETQLLDLSKSFSLYLDNIRDPGNLGTILRIADWFGAAQVFCSPDSTELYNPKTIQSAMGAFLRVKVSYIALNELLNQQSCKVFGAVLDGKNIYAEKLSPGLIIIGNEANGISGDNLKRITHPLTIPAHEANQTESLNAAMATAIICSEFFRQLSH